MSAARKMPKVPGWTVEDLHEGFAQCFREEEVLYDSRTGHQRLRLIRNATFGRILLLDDIVQTTEGDEFIYHEMMAHVPILAHGAARRVLIIGGGDGGMAREVLRHRTVERLTQVEIDARVIEFCREYLPTLSAGAFDDPRLDLVIADAADYVREATDSFDVIICDTTDPVGPGEVLFSESFYGHLARRLAPGGIVVTQNGVPFLQADELAGTMRAFRSLFRDATCYMATVPTYAGGPLAIGWGTDSQARATPLAELERRFAEAAIETRYYTPEVHRAAFALPRYVSAAMP